MPSPRTGTGRDKGSPKRSDTNEVELTNLTNGSTTVDLHSTSNNFNTTADLAQVNIQIDSRSSSPTQSPKEKTKSKKRKGNSQSPPRGDRGDITIQETENYMHMMTDDMNGGTQDLQKDEVYEIQSDPRKVQVFDKVETVLGTNIPALYKKKVRGIPDCGPSNTFRFLSYSTAMEYNREQRPGRFITELGATKEEHITIDSATGESAMKQYREKRLRAAKTTKTNYSYSQNTGFFFFNGWEWIEKYMPGTFSNAKEFEANEKINIILYFKFMKFMIVLFCVLSALTVFPLATYWQRAKYINSEEMDLSYQRSPFSVLKYFSMGKIWGEANECRRIEEGDYFSIGCYGGYISEITAYYGQPSGGCQCPLDQQPNTAGKCPSTVSHRTSGNDMPQCIDGTGYCFRGHLDNYDSQVCCASQMDQDDFVPDFNSIENLVDNPSCTSETLPFIIQNMCLGQQNCTLYADFNHTVEYVATTAEACGPYNEWPFEYNYNLNGVAYDDLYQCTTKLGGKGNWSGCSAQNMSANYMIVRASCDFDDATILGISRSPDNINFLLCTFNGILAFLFFYCIMWMTDLQKIELRKNSKSATTAKDYTIHVTNLPITSDLLMMESDLKDHFTRALNVSKVIRQEIRCKVLDVNLVLTDVDQIKLLADRGEIARQIDVTRTKIALGDKYRSASSLTLWYYDKKLKWYENQFKKKFSEIDANIEAYNQGKKVFPVSAFVTFEQEEAVHRLLRDYPQAGWLSPYLTPKHLKFLQKYPIRVKQAPNPNTLIWERMNQSKFLFSMRKRFSGIVLLLVICVSFAISYRNKIEKDKILRIYPKTDCNQYQIYPDEEGVYKYKNMLTLGDVVIDQMGSYYGEEYGNTGLLGCFCKELYARSGYEAMRAFTFPNPETGTDELWCEEWDNVNINLIVAQWWQVGCILIVSLLFRYLVRWLVLFEGYESTSSMNKVVTLRLFYTTLFNNAFLIPLIHFDWSIILEPYVLYFYHVAPLQWTDMDFFKSFVGYNDFTVEWFADCGLLMQFILIGTIFIPHIKPITEILVNKFRQFLDRGCTMNFHITTCTSQEELNQLYRAPPFLVEERYAHMLVVIYTSILWCGGIPLMIPLGLLNLITTYYVDKFMYIRVYEAPQENDEEVPLLTMDLLQLAAFFNLTLSIFAFTSPQLFPEYDGETFLGRIWNIKVAFMSILWCAFFVYLVFVQYILQNLKKAKLTCGLGFFLSFLAETHIWKGNPLFLQGLTTKQIQDTVRRNLLKKKIIDRYKLEFSRRKGGKAVPDRNLLGLDSYDIKANTRLMDKFNLGSPAIWQYMQNLQKKRDARRPSLEFNDGGNPKNPQYLYKRSKFIRDAYREVKISEAKELKEKQRLEQEKKRKEMMGYLEKFGPQAKPIPKRGKGRRSTRK